MKYLLRVWVSLTRPTLAWNIFRSSRYQPERFSSQTHIERVSEYQLYELSLTSALQIACTSNAERVNDILNQFKEIPLSREPDTGVIPANFDASEELAAVCYCIARLRRPSVVVETGVGRGVSSYYILHALEDNGAGHLYSIELPKRKSSMKRAVGKLVPTRLRRRWTLIFGTGLQELKWLCGKLRRVDMFIHDSDHTYFNQLAEYQSALACMNKGGILVSDDVTNDALLEASEEFGCSSLVIRQNKSGYIGIILKQDSQCP
jgi:predicted O-methyltransferase YrrM